MADTPVITAAQQRRIDEDTIEAKLAKARAKIRANFPDERAPLTWRRDTPTRLVSTCGRFHIDKRGESDAARYTAVLRPTSIIGNRRYTIEQAKEDCNRHASPLPLEPAQRELAAVSDREPGSDDE